MNETDDQIVIDESTGMAFMPIPGGSFLMGSPLTEKERKEVEGPQHKVDIKTFYMACFPVTQEQYFAIMGENVSYIYAENSPVDGVSWEEAQQFILRLNGMSKANYRLPSEAEWEYACRAHTQTRFFFGDNITTDQVNYGAKISCRNSSIGEHPTNSFGLYDMHGNVFEWCEDDWHPNYEGAPTDGRAWLAAESAHKVYRGGSWNASAHFARSAYRFHKLRSSAYYNLGFRLAFSL